MKSPEMMFLKRCGHKESCKCNIIPFERVHEKQNFTVDPVLLDKIAPSVRKNLHVVNGPNGTYQIEIERQRGRDDCGDTVLSMLGIKTHKPKNGGEINVGTAAKLLCTGPGDFTQSLDSLNHSDPYMVLVPSKEERTLGMTGNHWVLVAGEAVIDPAKGLMPRGIFDQKYQGREIIALRANINRRRFGAAA